MAPAKIALLSVYRKEGILDLSKGLIKAGYTLLGSGGTAKAIREAGMNIEEVSHVTKSPEILGGRVKTLHPTIHGGILARDIESDAADLTAQGIDQIGIVVCNLYPFEDVVKQPGVTIDEAVEEVDIGGVTLLRAAAKNHKRVVVLSSPEQYFDFLKELETGSIAQSTRDRLSLAAFEKCADYDDAISGYFRGKYAGDGLQQLHLRYGTNPHQKPAAAYVTGGKLPFKALSGSPGYINLLDALNAWSLVKELSAALQLPAAASFKHVSPAGAAVAVPLTDIEKNVYAVQDIEGIDDSKVAIAYARARGADRQSSFGDMIAISDEVDVVTAKIISREVSDGIIAPSYSAEALAILKKKKAGKYLILQMDPNYEPPEQETKVVYGIHLPQRRNDAKITAETFKNAVAPNTLPESALRDLVVATLAIKYTQSNSVCYALNGQVTGLGAGGQSRIGMTRQAGQKSDNWWMRFHERSLNLKFKPGLKRADKANAIDSLCGGHIPPTGPEREDYASKFEEVPADFTPEERTAWLAKLNEMALSSDAFFPFTDNVFRAARSGVKYIAAPLGSQADAQVKDTCQQLGITFVEQSTRLFTH